MTDLLIESKAMPLVTTLNFSGRTEAALAFYREALEVETLFLMHGRDCPVPAYQEGPYADLVFHATFRIEGTLVMASDVGYTAERGRIPFSGFAFSVTRGDHQQGAEVFRLLSREGVVVVPFTESLFKSSYGVLEDRFGLTWKVSVEG